MIIYLLLSIRETHILKYNLRRLSVQRFRHLAFLLNVRQLQKTPKAGRIRICQFQVGIRIYNPCDKAGKTVDGAKVYKEPGHGNLSPETGINQIAVGKTVSEHIQQKLHAVHGNHLPVMAPLHLYPFAEYFLTQCHQPVVHGKNPHILSHFRIPECLFQVIDFPVGLGKLLSGGKLPEISQTEYPVIDKRKQKQNRHKPWLQYAQYRGIQEETCHIDNQVLGISQHPVADSPVPALHAVVGTFYDFLFIAVLHIAIEAFCLP